MTHPSRRKPKIAAHSDRDQSSDLKDSVKGLLRHNGLRAPKAKSMKRKRHAATMGLPKVSQNDGKTDTTNQLAMSSTTMPSTSSSAVDTDGPSTQNSLSGNSTYNSVTTPLKTLGLADHSSEPSKQVMAKKPDNGGSKGTQGSNNVETTHITSQTKSATANNANGPNTQCQPNSVSVFDTTPPLKKTSGDSVSSLKSPESASISGPSSQLRPITEHSSSTPRTQQGSLSESGKQPEKQRESQFGGSGDTSTTGVTLFGSSSLSQTKQQPQTSSVCGGTGNVTQAQSQPQQGSNRSSFVSSSGAAASSLLGSAGSSGPGATGHRPDTAAGSTSTFQRVRQSSSGDGPFSQTGNTVTPSTFQSSSPAQSSAADIRFGQGPSTTSAVPNQVTGNSGRTFTVSGPFNLTYSVAAAGTSTFGSSGVPSAGSGLPNQAAITTSPSSLFGSTGRLFMGNEQLGRTATTDDAAGGSLVPSAASSSSGPRNTVQSGAFRTALAQTSLSGNSAPTGGQATQGQPRSGLFNQQSRNIAISTTMADVPQHRPTGNSAHAQPPGIAVPAHVRLLPPNTSTITTSTAAQPRNTALGGVAATNQTNQTQHNATVPPVNTIPQAGTAQAGGFVPAQPQQTAAQAIRQNLSAPAGVSVGTIRHIDGKSYSLLGRLDSNFFLRSMTRPGSVYETALSSDGSLWSRRPDRRPPTNPSPPSPPSSPPATAGMKQRPTSPSNLLNKDPVSRSQQSDDPSTPVANTTASGQSA